jgi:hypothetical protein
MLGIDKLYSIGAKGHIYIHVQVCKYAGNPLIGGETTIYKYTSNRNQLIATTRTPRLTGYLKEDNVG